VPHTVTVPRRLTNLLLLALVFGLVATGLLGWILPMAPATPLYELHRMLGITVVVALVWKQVIARASLRRRLRPRVDRSVVVGFAAAVALCTSLGIGLAWSLGFVSFDSLWGYSALNLHVFAGVALLPLAVWHLAGRWERKPRLTRLISRRSALRLAALSAGAFVLTRLLDFAGSATARRATGSRHAGSFTGNALPVTSWFLDRTPRLTAAEWRLSVGGTVDPTVTFDYAQLRRFQRQEVRAVLDCTGGWWSEQLWQGVSVGDLLAECGVPSKAREAAVISVTGHSWRFPLDELRGALLATHVGGEVLSPDHGYPVRLVVPDRRGFQWIKWVAAIEIV